MVHNLADDVEENIEMFLKLYLLLYADDAVLLAESPGDLQRSICAMKEFCDSWKLNVNVAKTKVVFGPCLPYSVKAVSCTFQSTSNFIFLML